jgi:hypothetical protein
MERTRNRTSHRVVILDLYLGYLAPMGAPLLVPRTPIVTSPKSMLPPLACPVRSRGTPIAPKGIRIAAVRRFGVDVDRAHGVVGLKKMHWLSVPDLYELLRRVSVLTLSELEIGPDRT